MATKIIIAGGSVAGLALANMLERFGIDFVVLEAYPRIAPQVGASIGLLPNGLRILDQLGCYEASRAKSEELYQHGFYRGSDGEMIGYQHDLVWLLEKGLGYPMVWVDRQMLLQVLYDNLKSKEKVLTNKRVISVDLDHLGVSATTEDGSVYRGTLLVGADGIHSTVRSEMWRLAPPGYFPPKEAEQVPVSTKCIFAISKRPPQYPGGTQQNVFYKGHSYLVVAAPENRVYWFLFVDLPNTIYGHEIPRYTDKDLTELVYQHIDDKILDNMTLRDLYDNRIIATMVPLQEYVFQKWYYSRIITIGDSAHKVDPVTGQGGSAAMESGVILVNSLVRRLSESQNGLSERDIQDSFAEVQHYRFERAQKVVQQGHNMQRIITQRPRFSSFICHYLMPAVGSLGVLGWGIPFCAGSHRLDNIDTPDRPHAIPFDDELPAQPIHLGKLQGVIVGLMAIPTALSLCLRSIHTVPALTYHAKSPMVEDIASRAAVAEFCANLVSLLTLSLIEVNRCGNMITSLTLIAIFAILNSLLGPGMMGPLCCGIAAFVPPSIFGRFVPIKPARLVLAIISILYIIPTATVLNSPSSLSIAAWRHAPTLCFVLARATSINFQLLGKQTTEVQLLVQRKDQETHRQMLLKEDFPVIKVVYTLAMLISTIAHITNLAFSGFAGGGLLNGNSTGSDFSALGLLTHDNRVLELSCLIMSLVTGPCNMRLKGYITNNQFSKAGLSILAANLAVGPGAALAGVAFWREGVLAGFGPHEKSS